MKLAFVNQRYGLEVNGGSEYYTRMLAEHLKEQDGIEVEVLTTKATDHNTWKNQYTEDVESINGITVRRFDVKHCKKDLMFRIADKLRRMNVKPRKLIEKNWIVQQGPYAPELIRYIKEHQNDYDLFVFVTYLYYPTVFGLPEVADKAILIPTAHDEPYIYMNIMRREFTQAKGIVYLTQEEKEMVEKIFQNADIPNDVIGLGIKIPEQLNVVKFKEKYNLQNPYIIYAGRIDEAKGCLEMFEFFQYYLKKGLYRDVDLVLMGNRGIEVPPNEHIRYVGFLSEEEKNSGIAGAELLVLPSAFESLSISVLEAMSMEVPVLVNGKSPVLRGHVERSKAGMTYDNQEEFAENIENIFEHKKVMGANGKKYVLENYVWEDILEKVGQILTKVQCM